MPSIDSLTNFRSKTAGRGQPEDLSWYALYIQPKLAPIASATLCGKGYEVYLPLHRVGRRWSDRVKQVDVPLFYGYLFCRFNVNQRLPILSTPGVISVLGAGKSPISVHDEEIQAIRTVLASGLNAQPWPFLGVGTKVSIEAGPLAGLEGIITNVDKVYRLVVSVSLLQRSVAVEIEREWARPIHGYPDPADSASSAPIGQISQAR